MTALSPFECKLFYSVLRRVDIGLIYNSIAKSLKFDPPIQIMWNYKAVGISDLFGQAKISAGTTTLKP